MFTPPPPHTHILDVLSAFPLSVIQPPLACFGKAAAGVQIWVLQPKCGPPVCWPGLGGLGWDRLGSKFHTLSGDDGDKGGRGKVEGVSLMARETVRSRVWDRCLRLVPGLNEGRIGVKCSVCVAIKSWEQSAGLCWAKSHQSLPIWTRTPPPPSSISLLSSSPPTLLSVQANRHSGSGCGGGCP